MFLPVLDIDVHCPCDSLGVAHQPVYDNRIMYLFVRKVQSVAIGHEVFVSFRILHEREARFGQTDLGQFITFLLISQIIAEGRVVLLSQHPLSGK